MARFSILSAIVVLALAISPGLAIEIVNEGLEPSYDDNFGPYPSIDLTPYIVEFEFLNDCAEKLTPKCGEEVYFNIFGNETIISDECCTKLVSMGQHCHTEMVKRIIDTPDLGLNTTDALPKSEQIWNKCVVVAETASPSPSPSPSPSLRKLMF